MTIENVFSSLQPFLQGNTNINVVVAAANGSELGYALQRMNIHTDVGDFFKKMVSDNVAAVGSERTFRKYEAGYKPDDHVMTYVPVEDEGIIENIVSSLSQINSLELFEEADEIIKHLRFYATTIEGGGRHAIFLRVFTQRHEVSRGKGSYAVYFANGHYDRLRSKVFLFDNKIDCIYWEGNIFIFNISKFQQIFKYFEELRTRASQIVDSVAVKIPISNLDAFKSACTGQIQMMSKLASIANKPYFEHITIDDIKRTIADFKLDVQIVEESGTEKLVFDNQLSKRWAILKLLDDDYLGSTMTNNKYEVNSKLSL